MLTLGDHTWVWEHRRELLEMLPETWTHIQNLNGLALGFELKLLGVDWRTDDEFGLCMMVLERFGIMLRQDGYLVKRNPRLVRAVG